MGSEGQQGLASGPRWEHFPHQSDIGVRGIGASPAEAFEQAALALIAVMSDPASVQARTSVTITCEAPDLELLLVEWLDRLIYEVATRKMLFGRFVVSIDGLRLVGEAWGEAIDSARHPLVVEVKGATLTNLRVGRRGDGLWSAECVVDV